MSRPSQSRRARARGVRRLLTLAVTATVLSGLATAVGGPEQAATAAPRTKVSSGGVPVKVWMTTTDRRRLLSRQADLSLVSGSSAKGLALDVDSSATGQTVRGFGAAMTESSAVVLDRLPASTRDAALTSLFHASGGSA